MYNFRVGQEVAIARAVETVDFPHKNGDVVTIRAIKLGTCKCCKVLVDIGVFNPTPAKFGEMVACFSCGGLRPFDFIWWVNSARLAPLQTESEEADMADAIEEISERKLFQTKYR